MDANSVLIDVLNFLQKKDVLCLQNAINILI